MSKYRIIKTYETVIPESAIGGGYDITPKYQVQEWVNIKTSDTPIHGENIWKNLFCSKDKDRARNWLKTYKELQVEIKKGPKVIYEENE
jgi:hypothetical protein